MKMTLLIIMMLFSFSSVFASSEIKSTLHDISVVSTITPDDFYELISTYQKVFLYFYKPEDQYSKAFEPVLEEVCKKLAKEGLGYKFAKIDGLLHSTFREENYVFDPSTLLYITKNGDDIQRTVYTAQRSPKALLSYIKKKHTYKPRELVEYSKFLELVKKTSKFIIFLGDKEQHAEELNNIIQASLDSGIFNIFWTKSDEFYEKYGVEKGKQELILHVYTDGKLDNGRSFEVSTKPVNLTYNAVVQLINTYQRELVMNFDEEHIKAVLGDYTNVKKNFGFCLVLYNEKNRKFNSKEFHKLISEIAGERRRNFVFFFLSTTQKKTKELMKGLQIGTNIPALVLYPPDNETKKESDKFVLTSEKETITKERINQFLEDFLSDKLTPYTISEPVPTNPVDENGIYKIVGSTFKHVLNVVFKGKYVIVNFCASNERCSDFEERFARVTRKLNENSNLTFAKFDLLLNDLNGLENEQTPTLVFFPNVDNKIKSGRIFEGNLNTIDIIRWTAKNFKDYGYNVKVKSFEDDAEENEKEKFTPIKSKEDEHEEEFDDPPEPEEKPVEAKAEKTASFSDILDEVKNEIGTKEDDNKVKPEL